MKREHIVGVLFFGGLWGVSEATLGDALYRAGVPHASIPLTVIGLVILTCARAYLPHAGMTTLIASSAMLYKFLNTPLFGCHLLGIVLTGVCYDIFFNLAGIRNKGLAAVLTAYGSNASFALIITYLVRYDHWVQGGFTKVLSHVGIDGSVVAAICFLIVPMAGRLGERAAAKTAQPFRWRSSLLAKSIAGLTAAIWLPVMAPLFLNRGW
jgi:hypothetical protein